MLSSTQTRRYLHYIPLLLVLALIGLCACEPPAPPSVETITILHTNDIHGQVSPMRNGSGGAAHIAGYVNAVRQSQPNTLFVDAGDMTQGTPISTKYQGKPIFEIMSVMGYQAAVLGNHEFDNGYALIRDFRELADFPLLSANARVDGELLADSAYTILELGKITVALIGLTTGHATPEAVDIIPPDEALASLIPELRPQCDLLVLLTHLGVEEDLRLAQAFPGIDIIVGGHNHYALHHKNEVAGATIVQAGSRGRKIGRIDLTMELETGTILNVGTALIDIPAPEILPDAPTQAVVERWETKVSAEVDVKIGTIAKEQSIPEMRAHITRIWLETFGTDFAYQNPGGTRAILPAGDILVRNIIEIMPFANTLTILELNLKQVLELIEEPDIKESKEFYTVLTNSYVADSLIKQYQLPPERITQLDIVWRKPVLDYIREHGTVLPIQKETVAVP